MFHFTPNLNLDINIVESSATISTDQDNSRPVMLLTQLSALKSDIHVVIGDKSPMQGWYSPSHAKLIPAPTLISSHNGPVSEYITVLEMPAQGQDSTDLENIRKDFHVVADEKEIVITWTESGKINSLRLDLTTSKVSFD